MSTVSLVVPVALDFGRQRSWDWLRPRYPSEWELIECGAESGPTWSKGRQVNAGVKASSGDVLVIADADLYLDIEVLRDAIGEVRAGAPWVMPHGIVYRLSRHASAKVLSAEGVGRPDRVVAKRHDGPIGGGFVVCKRAAFDVVRGIDPRFTGWGGEDISFGRALDTLVGEHHRLWAPTWHFWHTPLQRHEGRRASPENERLAGRYLDAVGDRDAMRALVDEW